MPAAVQESSAEGLMGAGHLMELDDGHQSTSAVQPMTPPESPPATDRGYAWVVVSAVFCVNVLCAGYIKSFGITYLLLLEYFPDASGAAAGWIMGLLVGSRGLLSPVMGALTVMLGPRRCCLAGALITTLGLLLAIPAFSIYYMAFTLGSLVGIGICMSETPGYLLVTDYFVEKRSVANGFRAAGNPMGGILFSPLVVFLKEQYGLQGSFIIMAGVMLHVAVLATLMRPFQVHERMICYQHMRKKQLCPENTMNSSVTAQTNTSNCPPKKALDFTLFKNPQYLIYLVMVVCVNLALPNVVLYTPAYGDSVGLTTYQTSIIAASLSGTDFVFRVLTGYVTNKLHLNEVRLFKGGLVVGGVGCMLITLCSTMWQLMITTTLFSFGLATFWALIATLMANQFGAEAMASTWGFFRMVQGITSFFYPSFLGFIKDMTGSFVVPFLIMGSSFILGAGIFSLQPLVARISKEGRS